MLAQRCLRAVGVAGVLLALASPGCGSSSQKQAGTGADASIEASSDAFVPDGPASLDAADGGSSADAGPDGVPVPDGSIDGAGADGATADAGLSPELAAFCQKYAAAVCTYRQACGYPSLPPLSECEASEATGCSDQLLAVGGAFASGRVVYDATKVDACISDAAGPFCDTNSLGQGVASCRGVFRGTVAPGGTCYAPYFILMTAGDVLGECAGGQCTATFQSCPGQCVQYLAVGAACSTASGATSCGPTAYCDGAHCASYLSLGAACDGSLLRCDPLLVCGPHDADGAMTCEAKKGQGQACTYDTECDRFNCLTGTCRAGHLGETCTYFECDPGLKCRGTSGCQQPIALDGACIPGDVDACADGLVCEVTGTDDAGLQVGACHAFQARGEGQPCFNQKCATGLWCQSTSTQSVCRAPGAAGQACEGGTAGSCAAGLVCDGTARLCQTPSVSGGPCDPGWTATCAAGFGCGPNKTCEPKVGPGQPCDASGVCPDLYYCDGTCMPAKRPGAACSGKDGECIGGQCDPTKSTCNGDCTDPG